MIVLIVVLPQIEHLILDNVSVTVVIMMPQINKLVNKILLLVLLLV